MVRTLACNVLPKKVKGVFLLDNEFGLNINSANNVAGNTFGVNVGSNYAVNPFLHDKPDSFQKTTEPAGKPAKKFDFGGLKEKYAEFLRSQTFYSFANEKEIKAMMQANPNIKAIMAENKMPYVIYLQNLSDLYIPHIKETTKIALQIANQLNLSKQDTDIVEQGALFHDFGKVLVPRNLLEKNGKLTPEEQKIVSKHAILGYELLKTTGIEPQVAKIVKNHHKYNYNLPPDKTSLLSQIVTVADIYSALITKRTYKNAMPKEEALKILDKLSAENKVNSTVVMALKESLIEESQ